MESTRIVVTSKLTKCIISPIGLLFLLAFLSSCGNAKALSTGAVKQAEMLGDKMFAGGAPNDITLTYRLQIYQARTALQKKKYKLAKQEAQAATGEAERIIKKRAALAADVQERLKALWYIIEHDTFPRKTLVESCFEVRKAIENKQYEKAELLVAEAERNLRQELKIKARTDIVIQAPPEYFKENKFIPVYEETGETGLSGKVLEEIVNPENAVFIESKWVSPETRYVRVAFTTKGVTVTGWVEGRFVY